MTQGVSARKLSAGKAALFTLLLFVLFIAIGLITRMPALALPAFYGLHAVFAAPFFAFVAAWFCKKYQVIWSVPVALVLCAAFLGMMSPAMGLSFLAPAAVILAILLAMKASGNAPFTACAVGIALFYPFTVLIGIAFGGYMVSGIAWLTVVGLTLIGAVLAAAGAHLGVKLAK